MDLFKRSRRVTWPRIESGDSRSKFPSRTCCRAAEADIFLEEDFFQDDREDDDDEDSDVWRPANLDLNPTIARKKKCRSSLRNGFFF